MSTILGPFWSLLIFLHFLKLNPFHWYQISPKHHENPNYHVIIVNNWEIDLSKSLLNNVIYLNKLVPRTVHETLSWRIIVSGIFCF